MRAAASGTEAGGPIKDGERVDSFGAWLMMAAPEAIGSCIRFRRESIDRDDPAGGGSGLTDLGPEAVRDGGAQDGDKVGARAENGARARRAVDALGDKGQPGYVSAAIGYVDRRGCTREVKSASLHRGGLRAALAQRAHGGLGIVSQDAEEALDVCRH